MKRFDPVLEYTAYGSRACMEEDSDTGQYVSHDDVQDMAYQIAECLLYTGSDECIRAVLNRAGFKTKLSFKDNVIPQLVGGAGNPHISSGLYSDELIQTGLKPVDSPAKKVCPACHTEHWGAMNLCDACDRITREAADNA